MGQLVFARPEHAVDALLAACSAGDDEPLLALFGREHRGLFSTSDQAGDRLARRRFHEAARSRRELVRRGEDRAILVYGEAGAAGAAFPIPLSRSAGGWSFDTKAGAEIVVRRRIRRNELEAISACRRYLEAQVEYASRDRDEDGVREYARRLRSSEGQRDGLFWETGKGVSESPSPGERFLTGADPEYVAERRQGEPWHGYRYWVLERQGRHAPGGAHSYVVNGNMVAGCALVAWPADPGSSGSKTFLVSHHGRVLERDLGPVRQASWSPARSQACAAA